jgi:hypothetical protein
VRIKFTGDFKELEKFRDRVKAAPTALVTVSEQLAEEAIDLVREGFERQEDPHGNAWEPHAALTQYVRPGGRILQDTGGLKASWHRRFAKGSGFVIASAKQTAAWMQKGTGIYGPRKRPIKPVRAKALRIPAKGGDVFRGSVAGAPQRQMVPEGGALPPRWKRRFVETAQDVLTELFR